MLMATSVLQGMGEGGVVDPYGKVVALTAAPDKAMEWGIDETRILPFSETVGGRYSLWSSIGFPAALALGWDAFAELLEGAAEMDQIGRAHSELQSLMRISYAVFCLKKKNTATFPSTKRRLEAETKQIQQ